MSAPRDGTPRPLDPLEAAATLAVGSAFDGEAIPEVDKRVELGVRNLEKALGKLKDKTVADYEKIFAVIESGAKTLADFDTSKGNRVKARAANVYGARVRIVQIYRQFTTAPQAGAVISWNAMLQAMRPYILLLKGTPPGGDRRRMAAGETCPSESVQGPSKRHEPTGKSKRRGISLLAADWRAQLVLAAEQRGSRYTLAIAVLSAVGCRPAELGHGVRVTLMTDGRLVFTIVGAKVRGDTSGQQWRRIEVDPDAGEDQRVLREALMVGSEQNASDGSREMVVRANAHGLGAAVRRLAAKANLDVAEYRISPYSFRHAAASDMKKDGVDRTTLAQFLGHRATRTSQTYGRAHAARGKRRCKVAAASQVKVTHIEPRSLKMIKAVPGSSAPPRTSRS